MTRRECQSCRHFQAAGFDNMGWCTHPKRRTGNEVRIYVRAHELQCRNDWANDLWQAAELTDTDVVLDTTALPVAPATADELSFLAAMANRPKPDAAAADAAARGEDVVVGEVTASIAAGEMSQPEQGRVTLRRAHEEIKSRNRERRAFVSPLTDDAGLQEVVDGAAWPALEPNGSAPSNTGEVPVANRDASSGNGAIGEVSPVALGEMGRPFPKMTTFPEDDARFSSIPEPVEGFELPMATRREMPRVVGRAGFDDDQPVLNWDHQPERSTPTSAADDLTEFDENPAFDVEPDREATLPPRRRFLNRPRQRPVRESAPLADDLLAELFAEPEIAPYLERSERAHQKADEPAAYSQTEPRWESRELIKSGDSLRDSVPVQSAEAFKSVDRDRAPVARYDAGRPRVRGERAQPRGEGLERYQPEVPAQVELDADLMGDVLHEFGADLFVDDLVVAPGSIEDEIDAAEPSNWTMIPRMCRTCRDFRPAENGERGWCTNKWAFSHRRMVDADELPCETSIGGWWLPHDDSWMSVVDVTAHSQPTPLLDQWLAHRAAAMGDYDAVQPLRRRQRS